MLHRTVGVFGNTEFAKKLGKQGTVNDIAIYNHGSSEGVFTYVAPNSDKIHTLLQVINMIDVPVIYISEITPALGEQMITISEFGFDHGFMIFDGIDENSVKPLIKGTCIENFFVVKDSVELVEAIKKLDIIRPSEPLIVPIDNYFNVKSVGTVILGIIKSGSVKKYDKVIVEPLEKEVMIKGIQSQDKDLDSAEAGMRIGFSLKGVEADELKRGYVIGKAMKSKTLRIKFEKNRYSKEQLKENDPVLVSSGLQVIAAKVKVAGDFLELEAETSIAYTDSTKFLIASTKQTMPRIIGKGLLF
ncbi:MAG: EF-Tu/IF-2/RF-3 family GTPase [Candidatus Aenigmatarchaeota archaeon]